MMLAKREGEFNRPERLLIKVIMVIIGEIMSLLLSSQWKQIRSLFGLGYLAQKIEIPIGELA